MCEILKDLHAHLLVEEIERDDYLEGKTPELMETLTEVDNAVSVSAHEIHNLQQHTGINGGFTDNVSTLWRE